MGNAIRSRLTWLGTFAAEPIAFGIVGVYGLLWAIFGHLDWHGIATLATWMMTLFIQRAEHRDTQAIQAKLDELLRATGKARSELAQIDQEEPETIERHRHEEQRSAEMR
jgi:low affinity Fe/Cu permease